MYFDSSLTDQSFATVGSRLLAEVNAAEAELGGIHETAASRSPAPGKWSPKQILGHLLDSAANNHQRFVRAQEPGPLKLPGYDQEHWVASQHYQDRRWADLVAFWAAYNRHLAHVIAKIPEASRNAPCQIGANDSVTLSYIALDYVGHVQHHLRQIFGQR